MTAETLKPFITPTSENFPATHAPNRNAPTHRHRQNQQRSLLPILLSIFACLTAAILLAFTIWNTVHIKNLQADLSNANTKVNSLEERLYKVDAAVKGMRDRLSTQNLATVNEMNQFSKVYGSVYDDNKDDDYDNENNPEGNHQLLDSDENYDDDENDDTEDGDDDADRIVDDDEDEYDSFDMEEWIKKYNSSSSYEGEDEEDELHNQSDDDNLYDDFEKFKDSKNKRNQQSGTRKSRSIANVSNDFTTLPLNKTAIGSDASAASISANTATTTDPNMVVERNNRHLHKLLKQRQAHKLSAEASADNLGDSRSSSRGSSGGHFVATSNGDSKRFSPLRPRSSRQHRKTPLLKSGESLIPAKSAAHSMGATEEPQYHRIQRPAAHFHLNRKVPNHQTDLKVNSYAGDMYIGHASWTNEVPIDSDFTVNNGVLRVHEAGLYYVYAQVCYNNSHDQNGFVIFHGTRPFLQCLNTVPTVMELKIHTCHTSGLIYLREDETIHLRDFHTDRNVILKDSNNRSYFGIIKI